MKGRFTEYAVLYRNVVSSSIQAADIIHNWKTDLGGTKIQRFSDV
jgi:hypothetical protein